MSFAVVDVETTGLDASHDRIIEIGIIYLDASLERIGDYQSLVNPLRPVDATFIHGITQDMVDSAPTFADIADDVVAGLDGHIIVAHNAAFDVGFLNAEFERVGRSEHIGLDSTVCTLDQARIYLPPMSRSLKNLSRELGFADAQQHRSLADAHLCELLFRHYVSLENLDQRHCQNALNRREETVQPRQWERARSWRALSAR